MENTIQQTINLKASQMAESLIGSEIIRLAGEIKERQANNEPIVNFTIGDFNPQIFPIPTELTDEIIKAYRNQETNYPAANGMAELRKAVSGFLLRKQNLNYSADEILISGGARPLIYAVYKAIVDPNDKVLFPVPSWNNNHYTHLSLANSVFIETQPEDNFMPTADQLKPYLSEVSLVALCSPLNPTGTVFSKEELEKICDLILSENSRRGPNEKPLYLMYDQIYWALTYNDTVHYDPVSLRPEMRNYTLYIDGMSKAFAATGVRVGWAFGPERIIGKMKSILGHVGAWSPKAEQIASAHYLNNANAVDTFLEKIKTDVLARLNGFYTIIQELKAEGYPVNAIAPQAAIYLTVQFSLKGKTTPEGVTLSSTADVTKYLLEKAHLAIVPFYAFGASADSDWYRLSVGTASMEDLNRVKIYLKEALTQLK
ncbi:MAG: pyridoxal phosphate-dependent aminotransferase [Flavobacteriales bacterium]